MNKDSLDAWILYDFNQGKKMPYLVERYGVQKSYIVNLVNEQGHIPPMKSKNETSIRIGVNLHSEIKKKLYFETKGEMMIKDKIKLIVLDYLEFHFGN